MSTYATLLAACPGDAIVLAVVLLALVARAARIRALPSTGAFALALLIDAAICIAQARSALPGDLFNGQLYAFAPGLLAKAGVLILGAMVVVLSRARGDEPRNPLDHVPLTLAAVALGFVCVAENLTIFYLGLQLAALAGCMLTIGRRADVACLEGAWSQFMAAALGAAFLLFGFSYLYGATNLLNVAVMDNSFSGLLLPSPLLSAGMLFTLGGLAVPLMAAPFHGWAPGMAASAPPASCAWMFSALRFAALLTLIKIAAPMQEYQELRAAWTVALSALSFLSLSVGAMGLLLAQGVASRLAFATVLATGRMLAAAALQTPDGFVTALYLGLVDGLALAGLYGVLQVAPQLTALASRSRVAALCFTAFALTLAGVPPLAGFAGLYQLGYASLQQTGLPPLPGLEEFAQRGVTVLGDPSFYDALAQVPWLFGLSLVATVASLAAWLPWLREVWSEGTALDGTPPLPWRAFGPDLLVLTTLALALVALTLYPDPVLAMLNRGLRGEF